MTRLTAAVTKNSGTQTASYDPVGNILSKSTNGTATSMAYNAADQLTSAGSVTVGDSLDSHVPRTTRCQ